MRRLDSFLGAIVLAGATLLTPEARADATPALAPSSDAARASETPLPTRPTKALDLSSSSDTSGLGWKLAACVLVGAAGFFVWRRSRSAVAPVDVPSLTVLSRTNLGVRSELVLIDLDGQRLLLGVTPSAIQNLYIAPLDELREVREPAAEREPRPRVEEARFVVAEAAKSVEGLVQRATRPSRPRTATSFVEGQARGIARARETSS